MLFMGIDGGGSTLRIGIYTQQMQPIAEVTQQQSVNPSIIGRGATLDLLQSTINIALEQIPTGEAITAIGIGIAGTDSEDTRQWLRQSLTPLLPTAKIITSTDYEIALVGAIGERHGVLLLAGTGSVAFGANRSGETARVGGWGYIMGDEGSGYWFGVQALKQLATIIDNQKKHTSLTNRLITHLEMDGSRDALVRWVYHTDKHANDIAKLGQLVLAAADDGDQSAQDIVHEGAGHLFQLYQILVIRLHLQHPPPPVAFAGGLLTTDNALSRQLANLLKLPTLPQAKYPPVVGGALLAWHHTLGA